jgi:hypothetical protein
MWPPDHIRVQETPGGNSGFDSVCRRIDVESMHTDRFEHVPGWLNILS